MYCQCITCIRHQVLFYSISNQLKTITKDFAFPLLTPFPPPPHHASCFPESPLASMPRSQVTFVDWLVDWLEKSIIDYTKYIFLLTNNARSTLEWIIMNYQIQKLVNMTESKGWASVPGNTDRNFKMVDQTSKPP